MDAGSNLSLRDATSSALRMGGLELLGQPQRLTSYVLDLADSTSREVRLLSRQLDGDLLAPLVQATRGECTTAGLLTARSRMEQILVDDRIVAKEQAKSTADGLAGGVADFMGVSLPSTLEALSPEPAQTQQDAPLPRLEAKPAQPAPAPTATQPTQAPRQTPSQRPAQKPQTAKNRSKAPIIFVLIVLVVAAFSFWHNAIETGLHNAIETAESQIQKVTYIKEDGSVTARLYNPTDADWVISEASISIYDGDDLREVKELTQNEQFDRHRYKIYVVEGDYSGCQFRIDLTLAPS